MEKADTNGSMVLFLKDNLFKEIVKGQDYGSLGKQVEIFIMDNIRITKSMAMEYMKKNQEDSIWDNFIRILGIL